ncbi:MAG: sigma-54-dependent Fis family transcriptional regulator, partial [Spirochaetia bacterium]|nr:sigma-54-dependent Fis family transcriptional regulator [Spirochaetia bacterium]
MSKPTILVVDDEPGIRTTVREVLEDERYRVLVAEDGQAALDALELDPVDLVVLDVWLPRVGGMDVLAKIKESRPGLETIVISGHASVDMAVQALKLGAFDFVEKPISLDRLLAAVRNALAIRELRAENRRLKRAVAPALELVGSSAAMETVRSLVEQSARSDARVLISGENGTGKELVARSIHERSERSDGPFVAVNCAAIPDALIESELFGHEKGAFTDAASRRIGRFEAARSGTLFLDEVADMSLAAQAKVLRAIQELRFERVGGEETIEADVRVIAATNKNLRSEIDAGRFREDLYFRLAVVPIEIPPLRERPGDAVELAERFLSDAARPGSPLRTFSLEAARLIAGHPWPGNVRELRNFVERVDVLSDEGSISGETVARLLGSASPRSVRALVPDEYLDLPLA